MVDEIYMFLLNKEEKSSKNDCFGVFKLCFWAKKISTFFVFVLLSSFTKNNNVKACLRCGKRIYSKLHICSRCDGDHIRAITTYYVIVKPFREEC